MRSRCPQFLFLMRLRHFLERLVEASPQLRLSTAMRRCACSPTLFDDVTRAQYATVPPHQAPLVFSTGPLTLTFSQNSHLRENSLSGCLGFRGFYFGEDDCKELAEGDPDLAVKNAGGCNSFSIHTWAFSSSEGRWWHHCRKISSGWRATWDQSG